MLVDYVAEHHEVQYPNGMWDQLVATFFFKRRYGFFILQAYVPTYMTIFVAWIAFWMDPSELSSRATMDISAFLAITLQFGTILQNQPPVSYIKGMDIWMLGCISFLFASLTELAIISYMQRSDAVRIFISKNVSSDPKEESGKLYDVQKILFRLTPQHIDRFCVIVFPLAFSVFNAVYWFHVVGYENL